MPRPYKNQYIFPPRIEHKISADSLIKYDTNEYLSQAKFNGSNCSLYLNGTSFTQRNRHEGIITNFKMKDKDILSLHHSKGDMVIVGEYMNKSQKDSNGKVFNNKFVIFDILVYEGQHLVGTTFEERYNLLLDIYDVKSYDDYFYQVNENVFLVKSFKNDFLNKYNDIVKVPMLEGLVLKKRNGKLERGTRIKNTTSQLKCRKETKNYQF